MPRPLVIFGTGEIADVAFYYFSHDSDRDIAAFTCDAASRKTDSFHDRPVVAFEEIERSHQPGQYDIFIAIGYSGTNRLRKEKYLAAKAKGYALPGYVSSKATLWCGRDAVGENCFILEHNNVQPYVRIGNNVTLWSANHIGHHSVIADHCFIASHVVVSGGVTLGERCFVGVNATLRDHICIGEACVIGAGAYIAGDAEAGRVYPGHPARPLPPETPFTL